MRSDRKDRIIELTSELENLEEIAGHLAPGPGDLPRLDGLDIHGGTLALNGTVGGDLVIYLDFKRRFDLDGRIRQARNEGRSAQVENLIRCQRTAGIAMVDVSGHRITDAVLAAMLHQAFLLGAIYELDMFGQITERLFENLNTQFCESSGEHKFLSLIYGEISEDAGFRFLSAAQPSPLVFSNRHHRFMDVGEELRVSSPPLGMVPSLHVTDRVTTESVLGFKERYIINQWQLMGAGDILLLHTDGLVDHRRGEEEYYTGRLELKLRELKDQTAAQIFNGLRNDLMAFGPAADDISLVVIKRT